MSNINRENVCPGSGVWVGHGREWRHTTCHRCDRKIRIRVNGLFYLHSRKEH